MFKCDCCGNKIEDKKKSHKVPLPYRYREKEISFEARDMKKKETRLRYYDFCEDCFNGFGEIMWMCDESDNLWFNNFLFPSIVYTTKHIIDKENEDVN